MRLSAAVRSSAKLKALGEHRDDEHHLHEQGAEQECGDRYVVSGCACEESWYVIIFGGDEEHLGSHECPGEIGAKEGDDQAEADEFEPQLPYAAASTPAIDGWRSWAISLCGMMPYETIVTDAKTAKTLRKPRSVARPTPLAASHAASRRSRLRRLGTQTPSPASSL